MYIYQDKRIHLLCENAFPGIYGTSEPVSTNWLGQVFGLVAEILVLESWLHSWLQLPVDQTLGVWCWFIFFGPCHSCGRQTEFLATCVVGNLDVFINLFERIMGNVCVCLRDFVSAGIHYSRVAITAGSELDLKQDLGTLPCLLCEWLEPRHRRIFRELDVIGRVRDFKKHSCIGYGACKCWFNHVSQCPALKILLETM